VSRIPKQRFARSVTCEAHGWIDSDRSQEFGARGGRFCLSDDSHGVDQVALNFHRVLEFLSRADISTLHYLQLEPTVGSNVPDARFPCTQIAEISVEDLGKMAFWSSNT
jgi:histidinol-phosphatase (PHP family)